ncbi:formyltetrahydrofolate deformylase [Agaricicola taiwanensis]|uniref:formyltetrahydrofolate deformylase n=1 Tax=Agaricicola taiwanensis TaxID=591372 RepID=UPI001E34FB93|nr:formyltetrahydrofolate deformylase [Agaricicola taiwanensis]
MSRGIVLTLACPDAPGLIAETCGFIFRQGLNIIESAQFTDQTTGTFFMRIVAEPVAGESDAQALSTAFEPIAAEHRMRFTMADRSHRLRALIMVSKFDHCLNDLLYRTSIGALPIEIPAVVSNHRDSYQRVAAHDIPYHHIPISAATKERAEAKLAEIIEDERIDLIVLARYMQVLSPSLCRRFPGRVINIHHSFLPSFKGAKPYHQAFSRGVKLIGATAHYVTEDLDEGPIIEQEAVRVDQVTGPDELVARGRDVEALVLSRAVRWHAEHRILLNGTRTVVFK